MNQELVKVQVEYNAKGHDELSLSVGDIIRVEEKFGTWWKGTCLNSQKCGLFPENCVCFGKITELDLNNSQNIQTIEDSRKFDEIDIVSWLPCHVSQWIESLGYPELGNNFIENEIEGEILLDLDLAALEQMDISPKDVRIDIFANIQKLKRMSNDEIVKRNISPPKPPSVSSAKFQSAGPIVYHHLPMYTPRRKKSSSKLCPINLPDDWYKHLKLPHSRCGNMLGKLSNSNWRKVNVILNEKILYLNKAEDKTQNIYASSVLGHAVIHDTTQKKPFCIKICHHQLDPFYLCLDNEESFRDWLHILQLTATLQEEEQVRSINPAIARVAKEHIKRKRSATDPPKRSDIPDRHPISGSVDDSSSFLRPIRTDKSGGMLLRRKVPQ